VFVKGFHHGLLDGVPNRYGFDRSPRMRALAEQRLGSVLRSVYKMSTEVPKNFFDVVVCSLVLMTIPEETAFQNAVNDLAGFVRTGGTVIIGVTHPCFRSQIFSDFQTVYSGSEPFKYFREGVPFAVTIHDERQNKTITFDDYHWTLSSTVAAMIAAKLTIQQLKELPDLSDHPKSNSAASPYLLLVGTKP
jgi:SAM-dependent methyltransferase